MIDMLGLAVVHLQTMHRDARPDDDEWYYDLFGPPPAVRRRRRQALWRAARRVLRLSRGLFAGGGARRADLPRASGVPS